MVDFRLLQREPGRRRRWPRAFAVLGAVAVLSAPASAFAAGGGPVVSGGGGPNPDELRLKHERAWLPAVPLQFGAEPYSAAESAAADAAAAEDCGLSAADATNLTLAPTWPEVAGSGSAPAPMTLSRYDDQTALADPQQRADGLFFNPGVGIWQLDSAGLGSQETAATAVDSQSAAKTAAAHIVGEYCDSAAGGASAAKSRAAAWSAWHACDEGACEDIYQRLATDGVTKVDSVGRYGGGEPRKCTFEGATYDCLYIDPHAAEGEDAWLSPDFGPAPVPAPFYAFTYSSGGGEYEVRYWLKGDSGADTDVSASRKLGTDARSELSWSAESALCDTTAGRGNC